MTNHLSNWPQYFCESPYDVGCTHDHTEQAYCVVLDHNGTIPSQFQYFADSDWGGYEHSQFCSWRLVPTIFCLFHAPSPS